MSEAGADSKFDAKSFLKTLPDAPGVYRMHDSEGKVIYVGKARSLKKRVASYFQKNITHPKTRTMVAHIAHIEVTVTHTENEALLLENIQIKSLMPRYNVLFRDDKSYPYIFLSNKDDFPRLSLHRGALRAKGRYFGPYPGAGSVRETLSLLQKLFPVRQCEDSFYRNRSRPCLQYQIKRCTAPCTGLITAKAYADDVRHAEMFLEGKSTAVIDELVSKMEQASEKLDFELAARYRDQIITMRRIQEKQYIEGEKGDLDVIAVARQGDVACVQLFTIRNGRHLGHRSFYPKNAAQQDENTLLSAFITQYYLNTAQQNKHDIPEEILLNAELDDIELLSGVLSEQRGHKVTLRHKVRGDRSRWLKMAIHNAQQALTSRLN
ncbi:MAG: excinuclease ABC subunit UvrC, partial [Gammaproteobacteria bacterium]|nr:excinuclease ABC subunit UvrC [Gammaproteobacteria bacterium]